MLLTQQEQTSLILNVFAVRGMTHKVSLMFSSIPTDKLLHNSLFLFHFYNIAYYLAVWYCYHRFNFHLLSAGSYSSEVFRLFWANVDPIRLSPDFTSYVVDVKDIQTTYCEAQQYGGIKYLLPKKLLPSCLRNDRNVFHMCLWLDLFVKLYEKKEV